ncbi:MAG: radical SAM-associated putative lipoprotein [Bacteroidales bacterium]|nr:radical SAM-associated putative lipoprotein [Bacteroidales bacterium]
MKKFNSTYSKGVQWVIAGLLTLLGFSACNKSNDNDYPVEYGTPHAKFTVSGKVTNTQGQALSQISVIVPRVVHHTPARPGFIPQHPVSTNHIRDTLYTKADGSYEYTYNGFPTDTVQIHLKFEEPSLHPLFESDSTKVNFILSDLKDGDARWYSGSAKKEVNMTLKSKAK